jgi:hypothetical protein
MELPRQSKVVRDGNTGDTARIVIETPDGTAVTPATFVADK